MEFKALQIGIYIYKTIIQKQNAFIKDNSIISIYDINEDDVEKFEKLMNSDYLEGITLYETVKADITFNEIKDACTEYEIDLIVMGSHGASGIKEMFVGSNAEKVVRTSNIPVLVIKNEHKTFEISNFVFASDFKNENKGTYKQAVQFANAVGAKIHLLLVNTANNFITTHDSTLIYLTITTPYFEDILWLLCT